MERSDIQALWACSSRGVPSIIRAGGPAWKANIDDGLPSRQVVADRFARDRRHRRTGTRADIPQQDNPNYRTLSRRRQHRGAFQQPVTWTLSRRFPQRIGPPAQVNCRK